MAPVPSYDDTFPAIAQNDDWSCSCTSTRWGLFAWGRTPSESWLESSMLSEGVVSTALGLLDASGAGLRDWLNRHYGGPSDGYLASNEPSVTFDQVAQEAATAAHPLMLGGRAWAHWTGVRGYDPAADLLVLANPASGYQGCYQTMSRGQWASLGSWSLVRLTHPEAESGQVPDIGLDYSPWYGLIGTGLLQLMNADLTLPGQRQSTWLPLGAPSADIESAYGANGTLYTWLLTVNQGFRYPPA